MTVSILVVIRYYISYYNYFNILECGQWQGRRNQTCAQDPGENEEKGRWEQG